MVAYVSSALRGLSETLDSEIERALRERAELGLTSPTNYNSLLNFYDSQGYRAKARFDGKNSEIYVSVAPCVINELSERDREKLRGVMNYFDIVRDFLGGSGEEGVLSVMERPIESIKSLEDSSSDGALFSKRNGINYDSYKNIVIGHSGFVKGVVRDLMPKIDVAFRGLDLSYLRHELDHVDFFGSPMHLEYHLKKEKVRKIYEGWRGGDEELLREYSKANVEFLDLKSEVATLLESRALFFDHVGIGNWYDVDFSDVKKKVYDDFCDNYVNGVFLKDMMNRILVGWWARGEMNKKTSDYLFDMIGRGNGGGLDGNLDDVNIEAVERILEYDLPWWKNKFSFNALSAIDIIGNCYEWNPAKLSEANRARSFDEYLDICSD